MTQRIYLSGIDTHPDVLFVPQCSYIEIYITAFYIPPYSVVFAKCFGIKVYAPLVYVPPASVVFHKRCYITCNFSVLIIIPDISLMVKSCFACCIRIFIRYDQTQQYKSKYCQTSGDSRKIILTVFFKFILLLILKNAYPVCSTG